MKYFFFISNDNNSQFEITLPQESTAINEKRPEIKHCILAF